MRFQVPQFVSIEDKVIGPFTIKQFGYYVVAVLLLIPVYLFSDIGLFITLAIPVVGAAVALAHGQMNGQSLIAVLTNAFFFYTKPPLHLWRRRPGQQPLVIKDTQWAELAAARELAGEEIQSLTKIAQSLEAGGNVVQSEDIEDPLDTEIKT